MAKEYDPSDKPINLEIRKVRRGLSRFYVAVCEEHGEIDTSETEKGAARILGDHMGRKHRGRTMNLK